LGFLLRGLLAGEITILVEIVSLAEVNASETDSFVDSHALPTFASASLRTD